MASYYLYLVRPYLWTTLEKRNTWRSVRFFKLFYISGPMHYDDTVDRDMRM